MRISDWSSDVCSSDLLGPRTIDATEILERHHQFRDLVEAVLRIIEQCTEFGHAFLRIPGLTLLVEGLQRRFALRRLSGVGSSQDAARFVVSAQSLDRKRVVWGKSVPLR